jgi:3-hydroxyisobutyrate dehydrogenase
MPEVGIGLVPDVGGSALLAAAPGHLGEYLGTTAARMNAGDAIYVGFADHFIPQDQWEDAKTALRENGIDALAAFYTEPPESDLKGAMGEINAVFSGARMRDILATAENSTTPFAAHAAKAIKRNSPLAMAVALDMIRSLRTTKATVAEALVQEYRFTARAIEFGDFAEGIRAAIIDKDKKPKWKYSLGAVPQDMVAHMRAPLGNTELNLTGE